MKKRVLFVGLHNSGRCQMAEALLKRICGHGFDVYSAGLDPRYEYLILKEGVFGALNGIGLAVSTLGDSFLYTNRQWMNGELSPTWGPIRKLTLPEAQAAGVNISFTS